MSKYIIEISDDVQYILLNGQTDNKCYTAVRPVAELEVLNSDYINEHYGELQDEAYQAGLNDAWEAAQKVVCKTTAGGMSLDTLKEIFGVQSPAAIMQSNTAPQAIDKIKNYEDKRSDRIEVGDIVEVYGNIGVVTYVYENTFNVMMYDGSTGDWEREDLKKTGRHYNISGVLEAMRE